MDDHDRIHREDDELAERGRRLVRETAAGVHAPSSLRAQIQRREARRATVGGRRRTLLATGAMALALVVLALALRGDADGGPTVLQTAVLAAAPPSGAAPAAGRVFLRAEIDGVRFPVWHPRAWPAVGDRRDELEGRPVRTVFYRNPRGVVAGYAIVGGDALPEPEGARVSTVRGARVLSLRRGGRWIVTWRRAERTCVIAAPATVPLERLVAFAGRRY